MKFCTNCQQTKDETEFNKNKARKDGLNGFCRDCAKQTSRNYYKMNIDYHKKYIIAQNIKRRIESLNKINSYKSSKGCKYCIEKEPCCLEFHHLRDKFDDVSKMVQNGYSWKRIEKEISKCDLVCANCHRKIHAGLI